MDHQTNSSLNIKVNAREVQTLEGVIKRTFDPSKARGFLTSMRELSQLTREMAQAQKSLADDVNKTADAYERLAKAAASASSAGGSGGAGGGGGGFVRPGMSSLTRTQIPNPSLGGIATSLAAVPIVGAMAAGGLMTAVGAYGSHLRYQQARVGAFPFLAGEGLDSLSGRAAIRAARLRGEARRSYDVDAAGLAAEATRLAAEAAGASRGPSDVHARGNMMVNQAVYGQVGQRTGYSGDVLEGNRSDVARRLGARAARRDREVNTAVERAAAQIAAEAMNARGIERTGIRYGVDPSAALGEASSLFQAAGRRGSGQDYALAKALQASLGMDLASTGGLSRGLRYTGDTGDAGSIAQVIGSAVARGLSGSELLDELQQQTTLLRAQGAFGQQVNIGAMLGVQEALSGAVGGRRAGTIARSFGQAGADMAYQGGGGPIEYHLLRAMGYTGRGGAEEFARYRLMAQDPGQVAGAMGSYLSSFQGAGMGPEVQALITQRAMQAMGTRISAGEARALRGGIPGGAGGRRMGVEDFLSAGDLARSLGGSLQTEAGIEAQRIGVGGSLAEAVQRMQRTSLTMAQSFDNVLGPAVTRLTQTLETAADRIETATSGGLWPMSWGAQ